MGRIALAATDPAGGTVDVAELAGGRRTALGRIVLTPDGAGELRRAADWRCDRRARRFVATATQGDGGVQTATATITTPSCAHRLSFVVVPARLRPGRAAVARVADGWRLGGISARVCARRRGAATRCRTLRPPAGAPASWRVPLSRRGDWSLSLASQRGQRLRHHVDVMPRARLRVLVTGDSMVYGIFETLRYVLGSRALVRGDPHPATGISKPIGLDWVAHARQTARDVRPDVTVAFVGAGDGFAMTPAGGAAVACCGPAWVAAYARRVAAMMTSYERGGRGLVYWVILPAPKDPAKAVVFDAVNRAIRLAAGRFSDGVEVVDRLANVVAPGDVFHESIVYRGRRLVVRVPDGVHLAPSGVHIALSTLLTQLRADGLLR